MLFWIKTKYFTLILQRKTCKKATRLKRDDDKIFLSLSLRHHLDQQNIQIRIKIGKGFIDNGKIKNSYFANE